jgi:putative nucleotidyltransferase with HDIG domain
VTETTATPAAPGRDPGAIGALITLAACAASVVIAQTAAESWRLISARPLEFAGFLAVTLALELVVVDVYGKGAMGFSGTGMLATGMMFGAGAGATVGVLCALLRLARTRGRLHRGVFNAANFALAAAAGSGAYNVLVGNDGGSAARAGAAFAAGVLYALVNLGLVTGAMSLSERERVGAIWRERIRWATPYYLVSGPLALTLVLAYERVGLVGVAAFTTPPAMMMFAIRQYLAHTAAAVEDVRHANDELRRANAALEERNDDLRELFEFAGGLAAQAHDRDALVRYAEAALERLTGAPVRVSAGTADASDEPLVAGGHRLGGVRVAEGERWSRLRDAVLPQLATALESAGLVDRLRKTHLETIAALSRSMEAKDYYTGGHTERVADVAVALARRLGYAGADLDAIEIGALLHDIGKIGIPERILHKPGPLDDEEWQVMKEHPLISEYILAEVELDPIVCQIARSSHERMDGAGYPDGLGGHEIPLAARIVLVADAFDALTSDRPYRPGRDVDAAIAELRAHRGTQFCPEVIDALEQLYREQPELLGGTTMRVVSAA